MNCQYENCKREFESDNGRKKFCSNKCKVAYHRRHGKKNEIKLFQMQFLYNALMEKIESLGDIKVNHATPIKEQQSITQSAPTEYAKEKSFQQHINEIAELQYEDEYRKKHAEIEASNLPDKQKNLLYINMKSPRT